MRTIARFLFVAGLAAGTARESFSQAAAPRFGAMTTSRVLLLPAQEVGGAPEARAWLTQFDSVLTARLEDGGVGSSWAYPRDAARYARMNPTYLADPHTMGAQPLKIANVKEGFALPEPFASRVRALLAVADARDAIVPVAARIDSTKSPHVAQVQLTFVDGRASTVMWNGILEVKFEGAPRVAADSLANAVARLFVQQ